MIDGDTIALLDGRLVRYLGIDTPEVRKRRAGAWVYDPDPYGVAATEANRRLVEGKTIRLEYDVEPYDRHGRLLAYIYVGDEMVNARLLEEGYARVLIIQPNTQYADQFHRLEQEAAANQRGMWAGP